MTDDQFKALCNTFGFAPSRALRELIDCATAGAEAAEREACARVCVGWTHADGDACAEAIRARSNT